MIHHLVMLNHQICSFNKVPFSSRVHLQPGLLIVCAQERQTDADSRVRRTEGGLSAGGRCDREPSSGDAGHHGENRTLPE